MINSGNANTFNGPKGDTDVQIIANTLASKLTIQPDEVLICSTGVIGVNGPGNFETKWTHVNA